MPYTLGTGGSEGCRQSITSFSSATGITALEKVRSGSPLCSSVKEPNSETGALATWAWSYLRTVAPPARWAQYSCLGHAGQRPVVGQAVDPARPTLRIILRSFSICSSRPGAPCITLS